MGFWEQLLDYFTHIDDILREFKDNYISKSDRIISRLDGIYEALTGIEPEPEIPLRHVPFYSEVTVVAGTDTVLDVKDDSEQGLGAVGRSGFIINDAGSTLIVVIDDGSGKGKEITVNVGETLEFERSDNIWVAKATLSCATATVDYRALFSS